MLPDLLYDALQEALPDGLPAESGMTWNPQIRGGATIAGGRRDAPDFEVFMINSGGMGARSTLDGLNATAFPSGVKTTPVEVTESVAPVRVWRKELRDDSGGPGKFRGGLGQSIEIGGAADAPVVISTMVDRIFTPVRGRNGGQPGGAGHLYLSNGDALNSKAQHLIEPGERLCLDLPGGGGHGDPLSRDANTVAADVAAGLVSPQSAREVYGVVLDSSGRADLEATRSLRQSRQASTSAKVTRLTKNHVPEDSADVSSIGDSR
jgi:N-methylhydantoinase B